MPKVGFWKYFIHFAKTNRMLPDWLPGPLPHQEGYVDAKSPFEYHPPMKVKLEVIDDSITFHVRYRSCYECYGDREMLLRVKVWMPPTGEDGEWDFEPKRWEDEGSQTEDLFVARRILTHFFLEHPGLRSVIPEKLVEDFKHTTTHGVS